MTQSVTAAMTYDLNGNTLSDGTNTTYVWDARNRLVSANNNCATFGYDPLGRRTGRNILGANTNYLYDGVNPVQELNGSTVTANLLTGGVDEYFTRTDSSGTANFLTDALGSTVALTDSGGNSQVQYSYGPFGDISITGTTTNSYTYTGRETDGLGLYYFRARYYNPNIGRFISEDPIGLLGGVNEYAYVDDDSMNFNDPLGMDKNSCRSKANRWLLIHGGLDALAGIPGVGLYAAGAQIVAGSAITNWNGNSNSAQIGQGASITAGAAGFANMFEDNIPGIISRGLPRFAEALPGIGMAAGAVAVGLDLYDYNQKLQECSENSN